MFESHLHFEQFAPDGRHKVEDAVLSSRELHIVDEQGEQDEVRKCSGEIHNLCDTNSEEQELINTLWGRRSSASAAREDDSI